jgi:RimJ/RimL family protein N-acetyltransferase
MVGFDHYNGSSIWIHSAKGTKPVASREFLHAVFHYAFDVAKVKVLIGPLGSGNAPAIRLNKHLGFKIAATLEGAHPDGALLLMTMAREECRFLTQPRSHYGRQQQSTTSA